MSRQTGGKFLAMDYITALQEHYPELAATNVDEVLHIGITKELLAHADEVGADPPERFVPLRKRRFCARKNAWELTMVTDMRRAGASLAYKGLINLKPAVDLILYSNLIWELQPKTIIELGALQ